MDMILHPAKENIDYRHKKFDQHKRSTETMTPTPGTTKNYQCERIDTPYSISSNTDSDTTFVCSSPNPISTPLAKRRKLQPRNQHDDSGISLTPQHHAHLQPKHEDDIISIDSNSELSHYTTFRPHFRSAHGGGSLTTSTPPPITPTAAILPKISDETLRSICRYHGNMVRKFPKKERTPKDQERRNKNTLACRMSRRVKKLEHVAIEEQYKEFSLEHLEIVEASMRASAYLNILMKLSAVECDENESETMAQCTRMLQQRQEVVVVEEEKSSPPSCPQQYLPEQEPQLPRKRSFSIAFLTGN